METKICKICNVQHPLTSEYFHSNGYTPKGTKKWKPECKACGRDQQKNRYLSIIKEVFTVLECSSCGYNKSKYALDFHHVDSDTKDYSISRFQQGHFSRDTIIQELKMCIILCANCHRELHGNEI